MKMYQVWNDGKPIREVEGYSASIEGRDILVIRDERGTWQEAFRVWDRFVLLPPSEVE